MIVSSGKKVSIQYTLKLDGDDEVADSNVGSKPLTFVNGTRQIIPELEKALQGMKIGDSKHVTIKPDDGYGVINTDAFEEIEKEKIPPEGLKVGVELQGKGSDGQIVSSRVVEIKEQTVVLDFNHPLAGKTLHFDVKILDIEEAASGTVGS
jgi:FKBP-type peptidyl-prolyl cis-trans isomerase SlyD